MRNIKKSSNSYYIVGIHPAIAALENPKRKILKVFCTQKILDTYKKQIESFEFEVVATQDIEKISEHSNTQSIAVKTKYLWNDMSFFDIEKPKKICILDQITDVNNVGAIIRSAAAFGIDCLVSSYHTPFETAAIAKNAAGALEIMPCITVSNIANFIKQIKNDSFWVYGLDGGVGESSSRISKFDPKEKVCIVLGSESSGLRRLTREMCDFLIKIPISKNVESLNVSNAAAISFFLLS